MRAARVSFDRVANHYDDTRGLPQNEMDAILDVMCKELAGRESVLDVGVGTGRFGLPLQSRGVPLVGIDISPQMLSRGVEKGLRDVLLADALSLPFKDASFDAVLSVHVLHLVKDWRAALREFARVGRRRYCSLATYPPEPPAGPYSLYYGFLEKAGYDASHPGLRERELVDIIPPDRKILIGRFTEQNPASKFIWILTNRSFSDLWNVPDDIHERAMQIVRSEYSGDETIVFKRRAELLEWDVTRLARI